MLYISETVIRNIIEDCENMRAEQGWLIGCANIVDKVDVCCLLEPIRATNDCYVLDSKYATIAVREWAHNDICAIGFIHSHLPDDGRLSRADRESAELLLRSLKLPFLYIGIVINTGAKQTEYPPLFMYKITGNDAHGFMIKPISYTINKDTRSDNNR